MQLRLASDLTAAEYVAGQAWLDAAPPPCPFHPRAGCQLVGHGSYARKTPAGARVRRFRCPRSGRTVSLLPDCLASHWPGSCAEIEHAVLRAEPSVLGTAAPPEPREGQASDNVRTRVQALLTIAKGLYPDRLCEFEPTLAAFGVALGTATVLLRLRAMAAAELASLPTPVGFSHRKIVRKERRERCQQPIGRDPPGNSDQFQGGKAD